MRPPDLIDLRPHPESLIAHSDHTLLIASQAGVIDGEGTHGLYYNHARLLSRLEHRIDGRDLRFAAASAVHPDSTLAYYQCPEKLQQIPGLRAEEPGLAVRVSRSVRSGMHEDVDVENYTQTDVAFAFSWDVASDFADLEEAAAGQRRQSAPTEACWKPSAEGGDLVIRYQHPALALGVALRFVADGELEWRDGRLSWRISLAPHATRHACVTVEPIVGGERRAAERRCYAFRPDDGDPTMAVLRDATRLETSNATVQRSWERAIADLGALALRDGGWPQVIVPAAGIPRYQSLFGRDSITAAFQAAMAEPVLMEATVDTLAARLGGKYDDARDEQPGRIIHQLNLGPLAQLGITPFGGYYGDFAAPPAFLILLGQYYAWTAEAAFVRRHYDTARRILDWIDGDADPDRDGFLEYDTRSPQGAKNQGWKDSGVAVVYEDGRGVQNPIAACELQGYVYAGKQQYAVALALAMRKFGEARQLLGDAAELKRRFGRAFWMPQEQFVAFALDAEKEQVRTITSNPGHCLAAGIVDGAHARAVAGRLLAPDMFSGWGIRTLSSDHPSFNPLSYQLGSVWPVETATIAFGLKRYGFDALANELARALFDAAELFPQARLPEVIGGYQRDALHPHPGIYPQAQSPQAWSASAIPLAVQAILGLRAMAPLRLLFIDPALPEWLPDVTVRNVRVGGARVAIRFHRERDGSTGWRVIERRGAVTVVQQPPESSVDAGLLDRVSAAAASFIPPLH